MRRARSLRYLGSGALWDKFPWMSFLLQAPQVTADLWGRGIQLGAVMGFVADLWWNILRGGGVTGAKWVWPAGGSLYEKAAAWNTQPKYQYTAGNMFTYEEHWLLLAADVVAAAVLMQQHGAGELEPRLETILTAPLGYFQPWQPGTIDFLRSEGWQPGGDGQPPFPNMDSTSTYGAVLEECANRNGRWLKEIRRDFPKTTSATVFMNVWADLINELYAWTNGGAIVTKPVFDPEELTLARMFEYGIFPPAWSEFSLMGDFIQRSLDFAIAAGRDLPGPIEMRSAAVEVWGEYLTA